jgi:hypothetical protein
VLGGSYSTNPAQPLAGGIAAARYLLIDPPSNHAPPTVSGTGAAGQPLTCAPGTWSGADAFDFLWLRDGVPLVGAIISTYVPLNSDAGTTLSCRVTARNGCGSRTATSAGVVVYVPPSPPPRRAARAGDTGERFRQGDPDGRGSGARALQSARRCPLPRPADADQRRSRARRAPVHDYGEREAHRPRPAQAARANTTGSGQSDDGQGARPAGAPPLTARARVRVSETHFRPPANYRLRARCSLCVETQHPEGRAVEVSGPPARSVELRPRPRAPWRPPSRSPPPPCSSRARCGRSR